MGWETVIITQTLRAAACSLYPDSSAASAASLVKSSSAFSSPFLLTLDMALDVLGSALGFAVASL